MTLKVCWQCNAAKPLHEFSKDNSTPDKLQRRCKACDAVRNAERWVTPTYRAYGMVLNARKRAVKKGWEFDLTTEWVTERMRGGKCEATGVPFILEKSAGRGNKAFSPSLDRKDNSRGYTMDNCHVVCWMYNAAKGTATQADVLRMAHALVAANQ